MLNTRSTVTQLKAASSGSQQRTKEHTSGFITLHQESWLIDSGGWYPSVTPTLHGNPRQQGVELGLRSIRACYHLLSIPNPKYAAPFSLELVCIQTSVLILSRIPFLSAPTHPASSSSKSPNLIFHCGPVRVRAADQLLHIHLVILVKNMHSWTSSRSAKSESLRPGPRIFHIYQAPQVILTHTKA